MTSNRDDLEEALRENLELRRELTSVAKPKNTSTSQRVSRGFHRLGLFLAAVPLFTGGVYLINLASDVTRNAKLSHDYQSELVCAQDAIYKKFYADIPRAEFDQRIAAKLAIKKSELSTLSDKELLELQKLSRVSDLKELGCSEFPRTVSFREIFEARPPGEFSRAELWPDLAIGFTITLVISLVVYGLVRAIGWVIGGFMAS